MMYRKSCLFVAPMAVVMLLLATAGSTQAAILYDDFASDPNLATDWTHTAFYGSTYSATWNSGDQDLDLAGGSDGMSVLRRTAATREVTDPVTLTIKDLGASGAGWSTVGLDIAQIATPTAFDGAASFRATQATCPRCLPNLPDTGGVCGCPSAYGR